MPHVQTDAGPVVEAKPRAAASPVRAAVPKVASLVAPAASAVRPLATSVWGSVRDVAGASIGRDAGTQVRFVDGSGRLRPCAVSSDGEYALHALALGTHWVTVDAEGYRAEVQSIELSADRPRLRLDFTLQKAVEVRVRITTIDGDSPLDADVARRLTPVVTREPLPERSEGVPTATSFVGRFEHRHARSEVLPREYVGVLVLDEEQPAWVNLLHDAVAVQSRRIGAGQNEVHFVVDPDDLPHPSSAVRVRVVDAATGLPLHRARVAVSSAGEAEREGLTDTMGSATVEARGSARRELRIRTKTYAEHRQPIDVLEDGVTDLGTITLEPEVAVTGFVRDLEGRPRSATFFLALIDPTTRSLRWSVGPPIRSREDGSFSIHGLGRGEYVIRTSDDNRGPGADWKGTANVSGNVVLDTQSGPITGLEVALRPASRLVLHTSSNKSSNVSFRVFDAHNLEVAAGFLHGREPRALELPPGAYRVAWSNQRELACTEQSVELGADAVTLDLTPR